MTQIESTYKQLPAEATLRELELVLGPPSVTGKILFKYDDSTEALVDVVYYDEFMPGYTVGFNPKNNGGLESVIVPSPNPATLPRNGIKWRGNW